MLMNEKSCLIPLFKKGSQLMVKESMLNTGKPPLGGLPRNYGLLLGIIDLPDINLAVYR